MSNLHSLDLFREKNGFSKFKSKENQIESFPILQHYNVDFENVTINLPKIGEIKAVLHKTFEGELKIVTILKSCTGKYYISILVEDETKVPVK